MIQIVMKPEPAPVVRGEGLYRVLFNGEEIGFRVRAKNARDAERKMMVVFRHELPSKTLDFNADDYPLYDKEVEDGKEESGVPLHQREVEERGDTQGRKCLHEEGVRTDTGRA